MAQFRYEAYRSPYAQSISELLLRSGDTQAQGVLNAGNARANAEQQRGQAWGGAAQSIGAALGAIPQQIQQQQVQAQRSELNDIAIKSARAEDARTVALKKAYAAGDRKAVIQSLIDQGQADAIPDVEKRYADLDKQAADVRKSRDEARQRQADYIGALGVQIRAAGYNPAAALAAARHARDTYDDDPDIAKQIDQATLSIIENPDQIQALADGFIGTSSYRDVLKPERPIEHDPTKDLVTPTGAVIKPGVPKPPTVGTRSVETVENGQRVTKIVPDVPGTAYPSPPPNAPKDDRIVQVMGPNGTPIWVRESDAVGKPAAQAPRAVTGQERQVLAFYNRAKDAVDTITKPRDGGDSLEESIGKAGLLSQGRLQLAPNFLQSKDNQSYRQAQRAFTEARLRKESGAAIPTSEYENDARTYFAQPGDGPEIVEQKRAARQTVLEGLKFSSGRAYEEYYGEANVSPARAASQAPKPSGAEPPKQDGNAPKLGERRLINGQIGQWDGKGWLPVIPPKK